MSTLIAVRVINNNPLRQWCGRYLTDVGDGLLIGHLSRRVLNELLTELRTQTPPGRYIAAWNDNTTPQRWATETNTTDNTRDVDGITVTVTKR